MKYQVVVKQVWSQTVTVTAKNVEEARNKAWEKYKPKKANYELFTEKE